MEIRQVQIFLWHRSIATTERYLHVNVDRMGALLARNSPLEGRQRANAVVVRLAMEQILGELRELVRAG